jgi:hypothetical protein
MITRVEIVHKDEDGNVQGGVRFFHTPGNDVVLYQTWEHRCAGPEFGPVNPDPIGSDMLTYLLDGWLGQREDLFYSLVAETVTDDFR